MIRIDWGELLCVLDVYPDFDIDLLKCIERLQRVCLD